MQRFKKQGFTLVEVLIVISIIALLAGITITAIGPARKKGRDAQRVSDLANIRIALAIYKSVNGRYPISDYGQSVGWAISKNISSGGSEPIRWTNLKGELAPYTSLPLDPLDKGLPVTLGPWVTGNYLYAYRSDSMGSKYDLVTQFEDTKNPNRCEVKGWKYHTLNELYWCPEWPSYYTNTSRYLYADH